MMSFPSKSSVYLTIAAACFCSSAGPAFSLAGTTGETQYREEWYSEKAIPYADKMIEAVTGGLPEFESAQLAWIRSVDSSVPPQVKRFLEDGYASPFQYAAVEDNGRRKALEVLSLLIFLKCGDFEYIRNAFLYADDEQFAMVAPSRL
jgi:hypothetical protein